MRTATKEDFKVGTKLTDNEDTRINYMITGYYGEGMWEARCTGGNAIVFECEAEGYLVS